MLRLTCANTIEEDIIERTTYKKELGGAAIDGGMFNEKSTVEDRHEFLRKILLRSARGVVNVLPNFLVSTLMRNRSLAGRAGRTRRRCSRRRI